MKKQNKPAILKRAKRGAKGLGIVWADKDPLGPDNTSTHPRPYHLNPSYGLGLASRAKILDELLAPDLPDYPDPGVPPLISNIAEVARTHPLHWLITINLVCQGDDDKTFIKSMEFDHRCLQRNLEDVSAETVEKLFDSINMKHYRHVVFETEVIGV